MKIATYHKMLGDDVMFFKGNVTELAFDLAVDDILKFYEHVSIAHSNVKKLIIDYIKSGRKDNLQLIIAPIYDSDQQYKLIKKLDLYRSAKLQDRMGELFFWDRIYITTGSKQLINAIRFAPILLRA